MVPRLEERRPPPNQRLLSVQSTTSKYSAISHSSSFEADDERSTSTESGRMTPNRSIIDDSDAASSSGHYQGEDTRSTSSKELAGWYMYAFAAETYVICGASPSPPSSSFIFHTEHRCYSIGLGFHVLTAFHSYL